MNGGSLLLNHRSFHLRGTQWQRSNIQSTTNVILMVVFPEKKPWEGHFWFGVRRRNARSLEQQNTRLRIRETCHLSPVTAPFDYSVNRSGLLPLLVHNTWEFQPEMTYSVFHYETVSRPAPAGDTSSHNSLHLSFFAGWSCTASTRSGSLSASEINKNPHRVWNLGGNWENLYTTRFVPSPFLFHEI